MDIAVVAIALALLLDAGCVALAIARVRLVERSIAPDLRAITAALLRKPLGDRLNELASRAREGTFESRLAADLLAAINTDARVAAADEALADVEQAFTKSEKWPPSAARIAAFGALLFAAVAFFAIPPRVTPILVILGVGGASMIACLSAQRRADASARDRRVAADALITALFGRPPPDPSSTQSTESDAPANPRGRRQPIPRRRRHRAP